MDDIVFFADGSVAFEIYFYGAEEFLGDAIGVGCESETAQALDGDELERSPAIGRIPLRTGYLCAGG